MTMKILHVEDDFAAAELIRGVLAKWPENVCVGHAPSGWAAIVQCRQHRPDVVLLDMLLPDMDGFDVIERLGRDDVPLRIIVLTIRDDAAFLYRIAESAVHGAVWKSPTLHWELREALNTGRQQRPYFSPGLLAAMNAARREPFVKFLSAREISLLPRLGAGATDEEISIWAGISPSTVHGHRQRIMQKLDLHSTSQLMRWAVEKGFTVPLRRGLRAPGNAEPWLTTRAGDDPRLGCGQSCEPALS